MNDITKLLNIEDNGIKIINISTVNNTKVIEIEKALTPHFCPSCLERMYSKGIYKRKVNHSMLQDGFILSIIIHQRRWVCSNPECRLTFNDEFSFVQSGKRISNLLPFLIVNTLKDINKTTAMVATQFHVSDTYVHYCFAKMVDMKRLKLPRIMCVDEVHLNISNEINYCFVMMNFETREIVDILPNRRQNTLDQYFYGISREERNYVEIIISDMYQSYLDFPMKYFNHSHVIIDSFH
ncbi:MAG: transposase, partial [Erysipelotrichia bacterium]|nr:transposase [Erysipelotrichia bacterium]